MNKKKTLFVTAIIVTSALTYSSVLAELATAKSDYKIYTDSFYTKQNASNNSDRLIFKERVTTASGKDDKGTRDGKGGTHGDTCLPADAYVTALVPGKNLDSAKILTAQGYPTFWFYNPYSSKLNVEFVLKDDKNNDVDRKQYVLPGQPGIINIPLSRQAKPLETGKKYTWFLKIKCNPQKPSGDKVVNGYIERVKPNPYLTPKATTKPEEKARLYAEDGLWLETLTAILQEMSPANPKKSEYIKALLEFYELQKFENEKVISCCHQQR